MILTEFKQIENNLFSSDEAMSAWVEREVVPRLFRDGRRNQWDDISIKGLHTMHGFLNFATRIAVRRYGSFSNWVKEAQAGTQYLAIAIQSNRVAQKDYSGGFQGYIRRNYPEAHQCCYTQMKMITIMESMGIFKRFSNGHGNVANFNVNPYKAIATMKFIEEYLGWDPTAKELPGDEQLSPETIANESDNPTPTPARWLAHIYKEAIGILPGRAKEVRAITEEVKAIAAGAFEELAKAVLEVRHVPQRFIQAHEKYCRRWARKINLPQVAFLVPDKILELGDPVPY